MIKLELYPILLDNRESLRETSKDDSDPNDIQYMTSSETEVVNFDLVKSCLLYTSPSPRDRG